LNLLVVQALSAKFFKGFSPAFVQALNQQTSQNQADLQKASTFRTPSYNPNARMVGLPFSEPIWIQSLTSRAYGTQKAGA
jgi:hypothetical protein